LGSGWLGLPWPVLVSFLLFWPFWVVFWLVFGGSGLRPDSLYPVLGGSWPGFGSSFWAGFRPVFVGFRPLFWVLLGPSGPKGPPGPKTREPAPLAPLGPQIPVFGPFSPVFGPFFACFSPLWAFGPKVPQEPLSGLRAPRGPGPVLALFGAFFVCFRGTFPSGPARDLGLWSTFGRRGPKTPVLGPQKGPFSACFPCFWGPFAASGRFSALQQGRPWAPFWPGFRPYFRVFRALLGPFGPSGPETREPAPSALRVLVVFRLFSVLSRALRATRPRFRLYSKVFSGPWALFLALSWAPFGGPGKAPSRGLPLPFGAPNVPLWAPFGPQRALKGPNPGPEGPRSLGFSTFLGPFGRPLAGQKGPKTSRNQGSSGPPGPDLALFGPLGPDGPQRAPEARFWALFWLFGPFRALGGPVWPFWAPSAP